MSKKGSRNNHNNEYFGLAIAGGFATGRLTAWKRETPVVQKSRGFSVEETAYRLAAEHALTDLADEADRASGELADVFRTHREMIRDPEWNESVLNFLRGGHAAADAVRMAGEQIAAILEEMQQPRLRERAADYRDIARRLGDALCDAGAASDATNHPSIEDKMDLTGCILWVEELLPSDIPILSARHAAAILSSAGGLTAHASLLSKAAGIPYIGGLPTLVDHLGQEIHLDAAQGRVIVEATSEQVRDWEAKRDADRAKRKNDRILSSRAVRTEDGIAIAVCANIASSSDAATARAFGCDGIALFRTEGMLTDRLADEEEQYRAYCDVIHAIDGPITVRTLDVGGDKQSRFFPLEESNPFLGVRGIRLSRQYPEVFRTQMRALIRATCDSDALTRVRIMIPMVTDRSDVEWTRACIEAEWNALIASDQIRCMPQDRKTLSIGMMVEVPAVAFSLDAFADLVDFISIGTNDLIQYCNAADRGNRGVETYYDPFHPGFLRMLAMTVRSARDLGLHVALCGDIGSDPRFTPFLIRLGVQELGVVPRSIPAIKETVRSSRSDDEIRMEQVLAAKSAKEVKFDFD
ncbi:MAG: phosphoenolpyruvate--protein phosphotransferase [Bacillota bacterium]|nr:phosphoenolpyruvate--protein phosphotransferase [Bacillota bacterium]